MAITENSVNFSHEIAQGTYARVDPPQRKCSCSPLPSLGASFQLDRVRHLFVFAFMYSPAFQIHIDGMLTSSASQQQARSGCVVGALTTSTRQFCRHCNH
jgi:hypothetical protein